MKCAITGSTGVLGKNFIKKFPKIKFIKYQGNILNSNKIISIVQKRKINNMEKPKNNFVANINKIKSLGWKPKYNILDIIKNFKKNYN